MTIPMRRFHLQRDVDVTGVSGVGVVADGVEFGKPLDIMWPDGAKTSLPAGWVRVVWRGERPSTVLWASARVAEEIHGHNGATRLVWLDAVPVEVESLSRPWSEAAYAHDRVMAARGDHDEPGT